MIVWINGASGSGKTQVAYELRRRLANGWIVDPEHLGFALRCMLPPSRRHAFRRYAAWRLAVVDLLREIDTEDEAVVVVPQALLDRDHHIEIVERLRADGHRVHHFTLTATPRTLHADYALAVRDAGAGPTRTSTAGWPPSGIRSSSTTCTPTVGRLMRSLRTWPRGQGSRSSADVSALGSAASPAGL